MKLIKVPFSAGGLSKSVGSESAPDAIIEQLSEPFLNEDGILPVFDIEEVDINKEDIQKTHQNIFSAVKKGLEQSDKCSVVGGDHSITYSSFRAFSKKFNNPGLLVFDACPNCINNISPPANEDQMRVLIRERILKKENLILVGLRNWSKEEYKFIKENKIKYYGMKEIAIENIHELSESLMQVSRPFDALYISIDISVVDPAFAPGASCIKPAGISSRDLFFLLNRLKKLQNLKALDLVEINPKKDINKMTVRLGAKILAEMC